MRHACHAIAVAVLFVATATPTPARAAPGNGSTATPAAAAPDLAAQLDALVTPHFSAHQPGAAVLVKKGDQVLLRKAYGLADVKRKLPLTPDHVFRIGSVTKQFTAAAILMLADAGKLALSDDVRKYVPAYPAKAAPVTLAHLLTHTGGVPNYTDQEAFRKLVAKDASHDELLATFKELPLEFTPGDRWRYSNSGYYLLGMVIEKVTGKPYAQFVAERLFQPLGMSHTAYGDTPGMPVGYQRAGGEFDPAAPLSMKVPFAAGALVSTVDDLGRWDRAIRDGKLLKPASWAQSFTAAPLNHGPAHYGFGWAVGELQGRRMVSHGGGIPGFNSAIVRLPEDGVVVVVLCNSLPAPVFPEELALQLAAAAIGKPLVDPVAAAKLDAAALDRYAGVYRVDDRERAYVRREGDHLTFARGGGGELTLRPESDTRFFVGDTPVRFLFTRDGAGRVNGVEVTQPMGTEHFARLDEPLPAERKAVGVDERQLERLVGEYGLAPGFILTVTRQGTQLYAQATGQQRFEIFATAATEFFLKAVDAQLSFHADGGRRADGLILHQGGRDQAARRIH
jgi:CubicO group peptidase (beta-lactamase class C family)